MQKPLVQKAYQAAQSKLSAIIDNFQSDKMRLLKKDCVTLYAADIRYNNALVGSIRLYNGKKGIEYEITLV